MSGEDTRTHYEVLGVPADATTEDIKKAHRRFARHHHPDVAGPDATEEYMRGAEAARVLLDPDERAAYDYDLAHPQEEPEPDEPVDAWATPTDWDNDEDTGTDDWADDTGWDNDEEVVDDAIVVDDPQPEPEPQPQPSPGAGAGAHSWPQPDKPAPTGDQPHPPDPDGYEPHCYDLGPNVPATVAATFVFPLAAYAIGPERADIVLGVIAGVLMFAVAFGLAFTNKLSSPDTRRKSRTRPGKPFTATGPTVAVLAAATLVAVAVVVSQHNNRYMWPVVPAFTGVIGGIVTGAQIAYLRQCRRMFSRKDLTKFNQFGDPPPGGTPAYVSLAISKTITAPMRIIRYKEPNGFFSHAVIQGRHVTLLRGINAGAGTYMWSGASLLSDDNGVLRDVLTGDYAMAMRRVRTLIPDAATVDAHILTVGSGVNYSNPDGPVNVASLDDLPRILTDAVGDDTDLRVCRAVVDQTATAMASLLG